MKRYCFSGRQGDNKKLLMLTVKHMNANFRGATQ